jgi:hypothetical protein
MHPGDNKAGIQFDDYVHTVVDGVQQQHRKASWPSRSIWL